MLDREIEYSDDIISFQRSKFGYICTRGHLTMSQHYIVYRTAISDKFRYIFPHLFWERDPVYLFLWESDRETIDELLGSLFSGFIRIKTDIDF